MTKKSQKKEATNNELKKIISEILVVNDNDLRPFIELLNFSPENITQRPLGSLLGFFEIKDDSEESAYIVNFLSSVIRKEYFLNPQRSAIESFESALHKTNLALSEVAKHGNVNWLGKMESAVCIVENNNIHFSVSGNARILLLRNKKMIDISKGLAPASETPYPMKTFVNVSSGKLEENDKFIITTDDLFHIFSEAEIKKGALRFSKENFARFLKTALVNELAIAGTILVDIVREAQIKPKKAKDASENQEFNAFSGKTFSKALQKRKNKLSSQLQSAETEPKKTIESKKDYVDKKTGHIYLKGDSKKETISENEYLAKARAFLSEKRDDFLFWLKNDLKNDFLRLTIKLARKTKNNFRKFSTFAILTISKIRKQGEVNPESAPTISRKDPPPRESFRPITRTNKLFSEIFPSSRKIKSTFQKLDYQQRIYSVLIIIAIVILPIAFSKIKNRSALSPVEDMALEEIETEPLSGNRNVLHIEEISFLKYLQKIPAIYGALQEEDSLFIITTDSIIEIQNEKIINTHMLPENAKDIEDFSLMEDLGLIFILTKNNDLLSFSTATGLFTNSSIQLPGNSDARSIDTYLSYLYILDPKNNQIYRYPRAESESGFGEKIDWLTEDINIENFLSMKIDGNIYVANDSEILQFFEKTKKEFTLEKLETPINISAFSTKEASDHIYILDRENSRLVQFGKNGSLIWQYYNEKISLAHAFLVDETKKFAYFFTKDETFFFNLEETLTQE